MSEPNGDDPHRRLYVPLRHQHRRRVSTCKRGGGVRADAAPRGRLARLQVHVLRPRPGADPAGHPRARAEPHRGGLLLAAPARAHLPPRRGEGRPEPVLLPDGEHPRARLAGCTRTRRRPPRRPRTWCAPPCAAWRSTSRWRRRACPIHPDVLVVGGGIAGIHAALTLANAGKHVYLVEREPTIGGHMAHVRQDLPHARLRRLHPDAEDVRGAGRTPTSRCGPTPKWPRWTATWATSR